MFYHDHSWGITRLNVYAGEAAPYIIRTTTEQALVTAGTIPDAASTIPLVIQDKTFVPNDAQLAAQDETWDKTRLGRRGQPLAAARLLPGAEPRRRLRRQRLRPLGLRAVVLAADDQRGVPTDRQPVLRPDLRPRRWLVRAAADAGVPYNSMGMEAFMDTPVVNGAAYPTTTLDPKPYRFRILNAANDRFLNLSLYKAVDANGAVCDGTTTRWRRAPGVACTEVALNPTEVAPRSRTPRSSRRRSPAPRALTGSSWAPRAASCRPRSRCPRTRRPGSTTRPCSTPGTSTSTRCSSPPPSASTSSWTCRSTPARR